MVDTVSWKDTRAKRPPRADAVRQHRDNFEAEERALRLRELREGQGVTQSELARRMHVTQPTVSALESGDMDRSGVATLRSYIEALGGSIDIVANLGGKRIFLISSVGSDD